MKSNASTAHDIENGSMIGPGEDEGLIEIDGLSYYHVPQVDCMPPFLMSIISDGDRWMFVSSSGALTAGRKSADYALFPYETDDRLHEAGRKVGPITSIRVDGIGEVWKPFHPETDAAGSRRLAKATTSDAIIFEEDHPSIPLTFTYRWSSCEEYGFVRRSLLTNRSDNEICLSLVDGLIKLLPSGVEPALDMGLRNLTNAYKRSELVSDDSSVAVYSMESRVSDRPEPSEMLRANVAWSLCPENFNVTLNQSFIRDFERSEDPQEEHLVTGRPGSYLVHSQLCIPAGSSVEWYIICDAAKSQSEVVALVDRVESGNIDRTELDLKLSEASEHVASLMASADAVQVTADRVASAYHYSNVLNNSMRGGVPLHGYTISSSDFGSFIGERNRDVQQRNLGFLDGLPEVIDHSQLMDEIRRMGDGQFVRLGLEYLPFSFSRRHGDPSRPWNKFSIQVHDDEGHASCSYEGNWRDIFQNWEALCDSFPGFITSVISVFVNASTVDGFNPYRISRAGIDWEVPDEHDPWANLGYWGDHQIAYLLALLESSERHQPGKIAGLLKEQMFAYADVPYQLADFESLLRDPKHTISFDREADLRAEQRANDIGGDGRLLWSNEGVHLVSLAEKLLVPALSKLANYVPGGGIWMNTQRPEWNDANNALVGNGLSIVTLLYLRRYLRHLRSLVIAGDSYEVSAEVATWLEATRSALQETATCGEPGEVERHRFHLMSKLGTAFSEYRMQVVGTGFSGTHQLAGAEIIGLCDIACAHLDVTIAASRRNDGLFHSYNILRLNIAGKSAQVEHLSEMLEGQVAALASGVLSQAESVRLVQHLLTSRLYRTDIESFTLYPAEPPKSFLDKSVIPDELFVENELLVKCCEVGENSIVSQDLLGTRRFAADLGDSSDLLAALDALKSHPVLASLAAERRTNTVAIYEEVFGHHSYTGRSSSMYAFEGIGSVYWHMVAKLLVALQDTLLDDSSESPDSSDRETFRETLGDLYWQIRRGMGPKKSAQQWGAIPTDPYSHSPSHAGAQQPGMTGFAKEEVLARPLELGLRVNAGTISFDDALLQESELHQEQQTARFQHVSGEFEDILLPKGSLLFSCCQVPVVVSAGGLQRAVVTLDDGSDVTFDGSSIDARLSGEIFARSGLVKRVDFSIGG